MTPGPWCGFGLSTRILAAAAAGLALAVDGPWSWVLMAHALIAVGRVPRGRLVGELCIVLAVIAVLAPGAVRVLAGITAVVGLVSLWWRPESRALRMNAVDRFLWAADYPGVALNIAYTLVIDQPLDQPALARAVDSLHGETPMLRTFVRVAPFGIERFVAARRFGSSPLSWVSDGSREDLARLTRRRFDLTREPPFRVIHMEAGPQSSLTLCVHHAAVDGEGTARLMDRLLAHYSATMTGGQVTPVKASLDGLSLRQAFARRTRPARVGIRLRRLTALLREDVRRHADLVDRWLPMRETEQRQQSRWLPAPAWDTLGRQKPRGLTRHDMILMAALRAFDRVSTAERRSDRPVRVMIPVNLRPVLRLRPGLQNFITTVAPSFDPEELRASDDRLAGVVRQRMADALTLDSLAAMPTWLSLVGRVCTPAGLRYLMERIDAAADRSPFSFVLTVIRIPRLGPVHGASVVDQVLGAPVTARPPLVLAVAHQQGGVVITVAYRSPLVSDDTAGRLLAAIAQELGAVTRPA